jgi:8-oxo-dGTP pyrophosphatase MutT (NUDIX family)
VAVFALKSEILHEEIARWGVNRLGLRVHRWCAHPADLIVSVRAVIFRNGRVVVVSAPRSDGTALHHIIPGGRREGDETLQQTLRREAGEETGWRIARLRPLAILHYHHLSKRPKDHPYAFPDFLQPVHLAEGTRYDRRLIKREGEIEAGACLMSPTAAFRIIDAPSQILLREALAMR